VSDDRTLADVAHDQEELRRRKDALDALGDRIHDALDAIDDVRSEDSDLVDEEMQGALAAARTILALKVVQTLNERHHGIHYERRQLRAERRELEHEAGGDE
jgi:hypothetical protein